MDLSRLPKGAIRSRMKQARGQAGPEQRREWEQRMTARLVGLEALKKCQSVYSYLSFGSEFDTSPLLALLMRQGVRIAVPKVVGRDMNFYYIEGQQDLAPGYMGIMEPRAGCSLAADRNAPVLVPGLAFDRMGNRIGYGGGYYDRFLAAEPEHNRIAPAYGFQVAAQLPAEAFDIRVHRIITEKEEILIEQGSRE